MVAWMRQQASPLPESMRQLARGFSKGSNEGPFGKQYSLNRLSLLLML